MTNRIGIIGGDGIGPEVINEGLKVIHASGVKVDSAGGNLLALCFKIIDRVRIHQN